MRGAKFFFFLEKYYLEGCHLEVEEGVQKIKEREENVNRYLTKEDE